MEKELAVEEKQDAQVINNKLEKLGFTTAVANMEKARKLKIAYSKYLFVTQDKINLFNEKLKKETLQEDSKAYRYKQLMFTPIENYPLVPPTSVLDALEKAKADKCFDEFEIAKIDWKEEIKDPILFARVNSCSDRFFISQWDDDVKFEDIIFMEK